MAVDLYQEVTDQVINLLQQGVAPWQKPWDAETGEPRNLVSGKAYRGVNTMLLGLQHYESPYWVTYKQAQDKGGHVRKGEKGTRIFFWKILTKKDEESDDANEMPGRGIPMLKSYTVFNLAQCEGLKEPEGDTETKPATENEKIEKAERVHLFMPNRPQVKFEGKQAYYSPSTDTVCVPPLNAHRSSGEFYSSLFHELGHSTGHKSRLNRPMSTFLQTKEYGKEELIAEMTSAFLCAYCGITNTIENSVAYLDGWIKAISGDKKLIIVAAAGAQKAADYILGVKRD